MSSTLKGKRTVETKKRRNSRTWDEQNTLITAALMKLAGRVSIEMSGIPYDTLIPGMGRNVLGIHYGYAPATTKTMDVVALSQIKTLERAANSLEVLINQSLLDSAGENQGAVLHLGSKFGLDGFLKIVSLAENLSEFRRLCEAAEHKAAALPMKGRPKRREATVEIVRYLGVEFERLTGKRPTRNNRPMGGGSEFVSFIADIFAALQIPDSPDDAVRDALG